MQRALVKDIHSIFSYEETGEKGQMFGLVSQDLTQIKPNYEALVKGGTLRITDDGYTQGTRLQIYNQLINFNIYLLLQLAYQKVAVTIRESFPEAMLVLPGKKDDPHRICRPTLSYPLTVIH